MVKTMIGKGGGLPPVWNLPLARNVHFAGRGRILEELDRVFGAGGGQHSAALLGMGGTGKTAVAVEYAYSRAENYDIVWWVRAETPATIAADLAALAPRLASGGLLAESNRQASSAAMEELQKRDRWLLIFDNASKPEDIAPYLPAGAAGNVLITSTSVKAGWAGASILVESWQREESIDFLRRRLGGIDDAHAAGQVAAALQDLPLALSQAAGCIDQGGMSLGDYLIEYENLWAEMLGQTKAAGPYATAVAMAWEISFRRLEVRNPTAAQLLTVCGFFSPDDIPLEMIQEGSSELNKDLADAINNPVALHEALEILEGFSLAKTSPGRISLHGVIGALAQDRLSSAERSNWAAAAVRIASLAFPFDSQNPETWPACAASLPHVLAATMGAHSAGAAPNAVSDLLSRAGRFLTKQAQYTEARSLLEMAYGMVKAIFGEGSGQEADIANNLARVRHRLGDLAGANELYEVALRIDRVKYGPEDPHMATVANNSAMTLVEMGQLEAARDRFKWALEVYRKVYPKDHPKVASVMNNLGFSLMLLKQDGPALEYLEEAMAMTQASCGQAHPQVACIAVNLGMLLKRRGRIGEARQLYNRALLVDEGIFGGRHPAVARDLVKLGQLLSDEKEFEEAVRHLERALPIVQASYGAEHRETAECLNELGRALKGAGDTERAVNCLMRAGAMMRKSAGRSHETVVGDEGMLG